MEECNEELLFNLTCVEAFEKQEFGDWLFYVNSDGMNGEEGDDAIWKIKKDGTENQRVQKSNTRVLYLIGIDGHWIYFSGHQVDMEKIHGVKDTFRMFSPINTGYYKMTIRGSLERPMSEEDQERFEDEITELEERL